MNEAREKFLGSLEASRRDELQAFSGWETRLDEVLVAAQHAWEVAWLSTADLASDVGTRLGLDAASVETWFAQLRPGDLYLACACTRGISDAVLTFERLYLRDLLQLARRFEKASTSSEDLLQLLRGKLFVARDGAPPKIALYTGRGQLRNWLRVTAGHLFLDLARVQAGSLEHPALEEVLAATPAANTDPELELLKRRHASQFKQAIAETLQNMDARDRFLLRQHVLENLSVDEIGALYGVHRATAARWVAKARDALVSGTRGALTRGLGLKPQELDSFLGLIASRLDASLDRLLAEAQPDV